MVGLPRSSGRWMDPSVLSKQILVLPLCCSHTADANAFSFVFKNTNTTWCTVQPTLQTDGSVVMCHVMSCRLSLPHWDRN